MGAVQWSCDLVEKAKPLILPVSLSDPSCFTPLLSTLHIVSLWFNGFFLWIFITCVTFTEVMLKKQPIALARDGIREWRSKCFFVGITFRSISDSQVAAKLKSLPQHGQPVMKAANLDFPGPLAGAEPLRRYLPTQQFFTAYITWGRSPSTLFKRECFSFFHHFKIYFTCQTQFPPSSPPAPSPIYREYLHNTCSFINFNCIIQTQMILNCIYTCQVIAQSFRRKIKHRGGSQSPVIN